MHHRGHTRASLSLVCIIANRTASSHAVEDRRFVHFLRYLCFMHPSSGVVACASMYSYGTRDHLRMSDRGLELRDARLTIPRALPPQARPPRLRSDGSAVCRTLFFGRPMFSEPAILALGVAWCSCTLVCGCVVYCFLRSCRSIFDPVSLAPHSFSVKNSDRGH